MIRGRMHYVEKATSALWRKNIATREALCRISQGRFGIIQKVKKDKLQELHYVEMKLTASIALCGKLFLHSSSPSTFNLGIMQNYSNKKIITWQIWQSWPKNSFWETNIHNYALIFISVPMLKYKFHVTGRPKYISDRVPGKRKSFHWHERMQV